MLVPVDKLSAGPRAVAPERPSAAIVPAAEPGVAQGDRLEAAVPVVGADRPEEGALPACSTRCSRWSMPRFGGIGISESEGASLRKVLPMYPVQSVTDVPGSYQLAA